MLAALVLLSCTCELPALDWGRTTTDEPVSTLTGDTGIPVGWVMLDNGYRESCGLLTDGRLLCWGFDGQVALTPAIPLEAFSLAERVGCGLADTTVHCWCLDDTEEITCRAAPDRGGFLEVQTGGGWACAQDGAGLLTCWGRRPMAVEAPTKPVLNWSIHTNIGCAVLEDRSVSCWGLTASFEDSEPPALGRPPPELAYEQVSVGTTHACALDTQGEAHCWGRTGFQQPFPPAPPGPWSTLVSAHQVTCGVRPDGSAACWHGVPGLIPNWSLDPDDRFAQMALGVFDGCGVTLDGRGVCFGVFDNEGELTVPSLHDL